MEESITITRSHLAAALKRWDEEAAAENWPKRDDPDAWADTADYLFGLMTPPSD